MDPFSGVNAPGLCGEGALAVGEEVNVDGAGVEAVHGEGAACFKSTGGGCFEGKPGDNPYFEKIYQFLSGLIALKWSGT